jgi:hypothetical protein
MQHWHHQVADFSPKVKSILIWLFEIQNQEYSQLGGKMRILGFFGVFIEIKTFCPKTQTSNVNHQGLLYTNANQFQKFGKVIFLG